MKKLLLGIMCAVSIGAVYGESLEEKERREIANSILSSNPFFTSTETKTDLVKRENLINQQQIDEQNKKDKAYKQKLYEEQEKRNQQTTCRSGKGYSLYESASSIVGAKNSIRYAKEELARDDEVSKIGGVQNMTLRYRASKTIVNSTERMKTQFSKYKSLGGTAPTANAVTVLKNPCI